MWGEKDTTPEEQDGFRYLCGPFKNNGAPKGAKSIWLFTPQLTHYFINKNFLNNVIN